MKNLQKHIGMENSGYGRKRNTTRKDDADCGLRSYQETERTAGNREDCLQQRGTLLPNVDKYITVDTKIRV